MGQGWTAEGCGGGRETSHGEGGHCPAHKTGWTKWGEWSFPKPRGTSLLPVFSETHGVGAKDDHHLPPREYGLDKYRGSADMGLGKVLRMRQSRRLGQGRVRRAMAWAPRSFS